MNQKGKIESQSEQYKRLINDMLTDKTFYKSAEFLRSIRDQINNENRITPKQIKAVNNIYMKFSENS